MPGVTGAYTTFDGVHVTTMCPGMVLDKRTDNGCGAGLASFGLTGLLLHEMTHHMDVVPGWPVRDGPLPRNASCYGSDCVQRTARDYPDCQNAHGGDAYMLFAIATNCSSPTPVMLPQ